MNPSLPWLPSGRPSTSRKAGLIAGSSPLATLIVFSVVLAVCALLIGVWLVRETVVWLIAAGFLAFSIEPLIRIFVRRGLGRGHGDDVRFPRDRRRASCSLRSRSSRRSSTGRKSSRRRSRRTSTTFKDTGASDSLNADDAIQTAGDTAEGAAHFFESSGKVLDLVGGLASAGFAAFMIFTFTLYFLVYGRELVDRLSGLMPLSYRAPFMDAARQHLRREQGLLVRQVPDRADRRAHDLRDDEAPRPAVRSTARALRRRSPISSRTSERRSARSRS